MNLTVQFILMVLGMVLVFFSERVGKEDKWEDLRSLAFLIGLLTSLHFSMSISQDLGFSIFFAGYLSAGVSMLLIFLRHQFAGKSDLDDPL